MTRKCTPCKISAAKLLGDGTSGSVDRAKTNRYYENLEKRRRARGKDYKDIPGVLTPGLLDRLRDVQSGRACSACLVPLA